MGIDLMLFLIRRNGQRICFFPVFQWETKDIGNGFVSSEDSRLGGYGMAALTNIGSSKIYFAIGQSHSDLKTELDNAMRRITDDDPYYADELHKQFLSVDRVYFLTGEEQKWLSEHGAIKIGYLINDGGVSTLDTETGKVSGLITDYIQLAQNCLEGCKKGCL